jgi:hypothetical protein
MYVFPQHHPQLLTNFNLKALISSKASHEVHLRRIYECTFGILFLGTPHSGTILATVSGRLAQLINPVTRTNLRIVNVLRRDSEVLARIQNGFHTLLRSHMDEGCHLIEITCFYEELPLPGIGTVSPIRESFVISKDTEPSFLHEPLFKSPSLAD